MAGSASSTPANLNESFRRLQEQVNDRIAALCSATAEAHPALEELSAHLADIANSAPLSRVGFFGPRGAGKTTLLNRLLGAELLPIGEIAPATAALAEVVGWQKPTYTAIIYYISQQDWDDTVQAAAEELKSIRAVLDGKSDTDIGPATSLLHGQLVSLHQSSGIISGKITKFHWESVPAAELIPAAYSRKLVDGYEIISHDNVNALNSSLDQFCNRACPLWPLVFKIQIFGPFKLLVDGAFSLVDIPGSGDGDPTLLRRYHEGQAMCDRLFYMPAVQLLSSPDTARHCGDARTHMSAEFGVIISCLNKISKAMKCDPREGPSRFCEQLKDKFTSDAQRDLFLSVRQRVYCIENSDQTNPVNDQIFKEFINAEFLSPRGDARNRIARYVNEVNLAFSVMRSALNLNENEVAAVKATFSSVHTRVSTFAPPPAGQDEWFRSGTHAPDSEILSGTIHYKELQLLLRSGGRYRHLNIPQNAVAAVIDPLAVKRLETAIQASLQSFNDTVITELLSGLRRVYTQDQVPPLDGLRPLLTVRIHQIAASCAEQSLRGVCGQELPNFERFGAGCRADMLSLVREWWQEHEHFRQEICNAIACLARETHLATLASLRTFLLEQLQALATSPLVSKTLKKVDLARLLTPFSEQPDNNPSPPAELLFALPPPPSAPPIQSAEQQLAALVAANPAIMSTYPPRTSPRLEVGYVYVLANPAYKDNLFKIGFTQRDPGQRAVELQKTGVPLPFRVERCWATRHMRAFEKNMHYLFASVRAAHNREFFRAPAPLIIQAGNLMSQILDPTGPPILP